MPQDDAYVSDAGEKPKAKRRTKTDEEIASLVGRMIDEAQTYVDSSLENDRAKATRYYQGKPLGNEEDGRSKVVMTEVRDTVLSQLPSLVRVFAGSDRAVEFEPYGMEDEDAARQKTDYVNYVFMVDNNGPMLLHDVFKDGLVRRTGFLKWRWNDAEKIEHQEYTGLTDEGLENLLSDDEVDVEITREYTTQVEAPDPNTGAPTQQDVAMYDATVTRTTQAGRLVVEAVPPEELLWNRTARHFPDDCLVVCHKTEKRFDELLAMGYERKVLEGAVGTMGARANRDLAQQIREVAKTTQDRRVQEVQDDETRPVVYNEAYVRIDCDGKVKLWKVCLVGETGYKLVAKQAVSHVPFALFCPDPEPHTVVGRSTADDTMDLQDIQSAIARGILDSLAMALDPATVVIEDAIEMKDLLNTERNRVIRARGPNANDPIREIRHQFVGPDALPVSEYFDHIKEKRTGQSKASQGLDADVLQSTTKAAVAATLTRAQERTAYIAYIFAHTGIRQLFRGLLRTVVEHQDWKRTVRLRNRAVEVDPRGWNADVDVVVNVALGAGLPEDKLAVLQAVATSQKEVLGLLGGPSPFVGFGHLRRTLARTVELAGYRNADEFYGQVTPEVEQQIAERMAQQAQAQQGGGQEAVAQAVAQAEQAKVQVDLQIRQAELELRAREMELKDDRERDEHAADFVLKLAEIEAKNQTSLDREKIRAQIAQYRADLDAEGEAARAVLDVSTQSAPGETP